MKFRRTKGGKILKTSLFPGAVMPSTRDVHDGTRKEKREAETRTGFLVFCACFVTLLYLAGCTVGPKYKAPVVTVQPLHNAASLAARNGNARPPSLDTWWAGFNDPELILVVDRAIHENLDLAASLARIEQARAAAKKAGAHLKPSASLDAQASVLRQSLESPAGRYLDALPDFKRNQSYLDLGIGATWELDLFGGLRRGAEAATYEAQAAEAESLGSRVSVAAETADAYMQIRGAQSRIEFTQQQIATDEHLQELVRQRRTAGLASDREVAQAEALSFQARATLPQLENILEAQFNRLDVLTGVQPGTYAVNLTTSGKIPEAPSINSPSNAGDLLRRRPDIIAAEKRLAASNARIGQALAEYYPKISLAGVLGNQAINPAGLFHERGFQPSAVAGLSWRLFDFGRVDADVKLARGANAEALLQYRSSVLKATEDVEDAFSALVRAEAARDEIVREIDALQRARDRSQEAYQAGVIALTDVLDADRQLLVARNDLALARESAARAAVSCFRALGGGWTP